MAMAMAGITEDVVGQITDVPTMAEEQATGKDQMVKVKRTATISTSMVSLPQPFACVSVLTNDTGGGFGVDGGVTVPIPGN